MWQYNDNELAHYGVLGMKWGKRSGSSAGSTIRKAKKTKESYQLSKYVKKQTTGKGSKNKWDADDQAAQVKLNKDRKKARSDLKKLSETGNKRATKALNKMDKSMKNDPDGEIAMTAAAGRNVAIGVIAGTVGGLAMMAMMPSN